MLKSMTGYGRGSATSERFAVTIDLKTVNNRFLDVHARLPPELSTHEAALRSALAAKLSRGRVDVTLTIDRANAPVVYELNRALIAGYLTALREMQTEFEITGEPDINIIARLPNVIQPAREVDNGASAELEKVLLSALDDALRALDEMRTREGASLATAMSAHLANIERNLPIIEINAAGITDALRAKLHKRIENLLERSSLDIATLDAGRLAQEVAYLAERSDITEEIARLRSHIQQFGIALNSEGEKGKQLDFLLQEFNREANTMLSKSTDLEIKEAGLAIKAEIEKLREQVQNVE